MHSQYTYIDAIVVELLKKLPFFSKIHILLIIEVFIIEIEFKMKNL